MIGYIRLGCSCTDMKSNILELSGNVQVRTK
jgi:hypothetical protein